MPVTDDKQLFAIRRDLSAGMNTRQHGSVIGETQATNLLNCDITVPGEVRKRPGLTLIEDLGDDGMTGAFGFEPLNGTNELLVTHGTKLEGWTGTSFTEHDTGFTDDLETVMLKVYKTGGDGDVVMVQNGTDNAHEMKQDHTVTDLGNTNTDPPRSLANAFFRGRWWILKDNLLYYSTAYPSNYSGAFDRTTNNYQVPVGEERAVIGIRDQGLVCLGHDSVWALNPSVTPAATDKVEKLLDIGCIARKTAVQVGDDILFFSSDGVRGLFRTVQDKVQLGSSFPLSFPLKEEFESINFAQISKASAVFYDNKYFLSLPVDASSTNNEVWIFYPAFQSWVVVSGWAVADWAKVTINGEERLYAVDATDGKVYQAWEGFDDNGVAIDFTEEGRKEDFGQPLVSKSGGEVRIRMLSSGDYDITVSVSLDDKAYVTLGTINLRGNAPTLPVALPFTLADTDIVEETFHLDSLGSFRQIRIKIQHNDTNGSDIIKVFERGIVTYADEYQSE